MGKEKSSKRSIFRLSLRFRLIVLVVLAALPALALTLFTGVEQRIQAEADVKQKALQNVQFAASRHELLIEDTRVFLISLTHSLNLEEDHFVGCGHLFAHLKETHFPFYSAFYVADLNGNILCTIPGGDVPDDLIGCSHYNNLITSEDFVISEYHICRNTGKGVISMGYPILDANDERIGVINISIDLKLFGEFAQQANLPPGSTLAVFDKSGTILAHYPDPEFWVGEKIPEDSVENKILSLKQGTMRSKGLDNVQRLYAYMPLTGSEESVFISIGIPESYAFGEVNRTLFRNLVMTLSVTVLLLLAAWLVGGFVIMRPIQDLVDTTQKLAEGNLDVRPSVNTEVGEFSILVRSITEMAEALAQREKDHVMAEDSIRAYAADLERSNRDLQDFANIASHDLQEPLRKIANFSDILVQRYSDDLDKPAKEYLERIQASVQRLHDLILGLLNFSRISTKTQPPQPVDLNETIKAVLSDLEFQLDQVDAVINVKELPTIVSDPLQTHQLFLNLISNSLKFRKPDTVTKIDIYSQDIYETATKSAKRESVLKCFKIFVSDNGIGFDEKYIDKVFQPFQRLHPNDEYSGSGMGLAICRKILERHGGEITAKSAPGEGATFIITYPCESKGTQRGES